MDKNFYSEVRKNWQFIHPVTRGLAFLDYQLARLMQEFESEFRGLFKKENLKFFYWLPRITGIVFIIFLSSFAMDFFNGSWDLIINSAAVRLTPSLLLLVIFLIAWKKELLGGLLFVVSFLVLFALVISENPLPTDLFFFGPILVIGLLFLADSYIRQIYKGKYE